MPFDPLQLLLEMESELTDNMIAFLERGAIASAEWQAGKLAEVGALRAMNEKTVEKYLAEIKANLPAYYEKAGKDAAFSAGIPGLASVLPEGVSSTLALIWSTWENKTMNQLRNLGMTLIDGAQTTYIQIVYKSAAKMLAGATTTRQAIAETARGWIAEATAEGLENGIPALVDKAGRNWSVESYAQVVLRSNERQMVTAVQESAFNEFDVDLVEISSHLGARPKCAPYQGKVYSRSGTSTKFPALSSTSKGQIDGLGGVNCGHTFYAYNPAVGKTYKPYPKKLNEKAYEASQDQRKLERGIRAAKKDLSIAKITGDKTIIARAQKRVTDAQAKMRQFIEESGRRRRYDREKVY